MTSLINQWFPGLGRCEVVMKFSQIYHYVYLVSGWPTPLKNTIISQLGWWHSQLNGNIKKCSSHHQPDLSLHDPKSLIDLRRSAPRARFPTALSPKSPETKPLTLLAAAFMHRLGRPWWRGGYPWVIKHGNGTYPMNGGFIRNITDKWSIFHCHVWLPEGSPTLEPLKKWRKIHKISRMDVNVNNQMDFHEMKVALWIQVPSEKEFRVWFPFLQGTDMAYFGPCRPLLV